MHYEVGVDRFANLFLSGFRLRGILNIWTLVVAFFVEYFNAEMM